MTTAPESPQRIMALDFLRGIAVMGILAMNVVGLGLPERAYLNPSVFGGATGADFWAWLLAFIFIDGKMRGLFSLLFGASLLLVVERADASPEAGRPDGLTLHKRRMLWLLLFGLIHYFFIWYGDILTLYALVGLVAALFTGSTPGTLLRTSLVLFGLGLLGYFYFYASPFVLETAAAMPEADPNTVRQWHRARTELDPPAAAQLAREVALHRGPYLTLVARQFSDWDRQLSQILVYGPETLAFMLMGMAGLKSGFLTGAWDAGRYRRIAIVCLTVTVPAYAVLASLIAWSGFRETIVLALNSVAAAPFRPVMVIGYAALILLVLKQGPGGVLRTRVVAAGRAAFTNYLGASIFGAGLFYGWGLGLYGALGRAELYLIVPAAWALMLLWSKPWLERYRYGPLEWLWRSLTSGRPEPMRRT